MISLIFDVLSTLLIRSLDLSKYHPSTQYLTNMGFSAWYHLEEIIVDSSSIHLY